MIQFIGFTVKEALKGIKANKEAYFITITTTAISISIFGIFLIVFFNLHEMVKEWRERFQIIIYLKDDITQTEAGLLKSYFISRKEIKEYYYVTNEEALKKFRKRLSSNSSILENLNINPLPASFELKLKEKYRNYSNIKNIAKSINKLNGIEDIEFGEGWLEGLETALLFLKLLAFAIGGLVCIGIVFIVSNTIKLSVYARREEIEIMQLVGATNWYIKGPFIFEGIIQGFLGTILSLVMLYGLYLAANASLQSFNFVIGTPSLIFIPPLVINYMLFSGLLIGCVAGFLSLRKFLKS